MAEEAAPLEPAPEDAPEVATPAEAPARAAPEPRPAPPPSRQRRRSAFRRRDEVGLVILAMVLTGIVWSIARGWVIDTRPPIKNVRVVWERPPGSDLDVVFAGDAPTVDVTLTSSDPEYQDIRRKLRLDGLTLRIGPLDKSQTSRALSERQGDGYVLPFHPGLLGDTTVPLPSGEVVRIETGLARITPPDLSKLALPDGLRVELLETEDDTFTVENVRAGLLDDVIECDMPRVDDLRLDDALGSDGTRWVVVRFDDWTGVSAGKPNPIRVAAAKDFETVRLKLRVYGGVEQAIDNEWRWARSEAEFDRFEFRLQEEQPIGVNGSNLTGKLRGTKSELAFVEANKGKWHWEIAIFAKDRNALMPTAGNPEVTDVQGEILFVTDGDPGFGNVRFELDPELRGKVLLTIKRKN